MNILAATGAAGGLLIGAAGVLAWQHGPWGLETAYKAQSTVLTQCRVDKAYAVDQTHRWAAVYGSLRTQMAQSAKSASTALTEAQAQCKVSASSSYKSGVAFGRALERKSHASATSPAIPDSAPAGADPVRDDFADFWSSGSSAGN